MQIDLFSFCLGLATCAALDVVAVVWLLSSKRLLDRVLCYLDLRWSTLHSRS